MRILLLEPDRLLAKNFSTALKKAGHTVDWQVEPQEAISALDQQPADVVVMDLVLANRSGIEFLYELRSYDDWQNLPVILLSSVPPREIYTCVAGLEQLQIKAYHYKPVTSFAELLNSVGTSLQPALA